MQQHSPCYACRCGVGFSELPNGLGLGGQVGNYGLFLDASLDTGHSRPNATYARWVFKWIAATALWGLVYRM